MAEKISAEILDTLIPTTPPQLFMTPFIKTEEPPALFQPHSGTILHMELISIDGWRYEVVVEKNQYYNAHTPWVMQVKGWCDELKLETFITHEIDEWNEAYIKDVMISIQDALVREHIVKSIEPLDIGALLLRNP